MEGEELLVCAATDAMRVVLGLPTRNFSREQIVDFLSRPIREALADVVEAQAGEIEELRSRNCELEAEVERLERREFGVTTTEAIRALDANAAAYRKVEARAEAAEAKLRAVAGLPRYWGSPADTNGHPIVVIKAGDLDAILRGGSENE